ncbi:HipA-like protein [Corallococcus coralloides]|uniref:HipA-like protein n=1 Tax=Corallococcus coralloides TaxID=184914 RepID=A0A410RYQ6_CORCK|nr:HipA domain-containing protein [Corallococcus coralloides]QAT87079.1 HipA-like protein [Corallococcus coralloides]
MDPTLPVSTTGILDVLIGDVHVGTLTLLADERIEFSLSEDYRQRYPRPVLGQFFEDDLSRRHTSRMRLPPFFSNLLPEGPLRDLISERQHIARQREFFFIAHLGADLSGAVIVRPAGELAGHDAPLVDVPAEPVSDGEPLRFSLAGVQLKFSMLRRDRGMTLPMGGLGGDWIVKLPDNRYDRVPENELSVMTWARATGIDVPELQLLPVSDLHGLPEGITLREDLAYAIRRFDRPSPGRRVHMEDLAQVLGLYSDEKYKKYNYETIANVLLKVAGLEALQEFLRRLVFIIACGNGDAHHKNWSLYYPDGTHPTLSPAYDFVSTIQYMPQDQLALNLAKSKRFEDVSLQSFERLARKLGLADEDVLPVVKGAVEVALDAWTTLRADLPMPELFKQRIEEHWKRVPLLQGNVKRSAGELRQTVNAFFTLYNELPRLGPGSDACTREALRRLSPLPPSPRVLDLGAGTGRQSLVLARELDTRVTAVDLHRPYLDRLEREAREQGLSDAIVTRQEDMRALSLPPGSIDLIWSEGAIYLLGFEQGLRQWRPLLAPGGQVAVTECTWLTDVRPPEAVRFWAAGYPSMGNIAQNHASAEAAGFTVLDTFTLPASAWWDDYYTPLLQRIERLRPTADAALREVIAAAEQEVNLYRRHGDSYGYVFYLLRSREA